MDTEVDQKTLTASTDFQANADEWYILGMRLSVNGPSESEKGVQYNVLEKL